MQPHAIVHVRVRVCIYFRSILVEQAGKDKDECENGQDQQQD